MNITIFVCVVSSVSGLLGVIIGAWIMYAAAARTARIEESKHYRELGLKIALTKFESCVKSAQAITDLTGQPSEVPHFEIFVIEGIKLMEIVQSEPNISADEMGRRIKQLSYGDCPIRAEYQRRRNGATNKTTESFHQGYYYFNKGEKRCLKRCTTTATALAVFG
jgi:hypothetical protein